MLSKRLQQENHAPARLIFFVFLILLFTPSTHVIAHKKNNQNPTKFPSNFPTLLPTTSQPTASPHKLPRTPTSSPSRIQTSIRNNVILMIVDDLSPQYIDPRNPMKMPNMKKLAGKGIHFVNAFSNFPVCGPSRISFLTGRVAEKTKLYSFDSYIPQVPGLDTFMKYLIQTFGYEAQGFGKVFHEDAKNNSVYSQDYYLLGHWSNPIVYGGSDDSECRRNQWFCVQPTLSASGDYTITQSFLSWMDSRKNIQTPLLAMIGLRKPHIDIGIPKNFTKKVSTEEWDDAFQTSKPASLGQNGEIVPFHKSLQYFDAYNQFATIKVGVFSAYPPIQFLINPLLKHQFKAIRKFYSYAAKFQDFNLGAIVDYIASNPAYSQNTSIVMVSDHGFSNGDHTLFGKCALFDQQTRASFIVMPAWNMKLANTARGVVRTEPVSLVDLFPTVVHLATGHLLKRGSIVDNSSLPLDGTSLLTQSFRKTLAVYAFMQYPRCSLQSTKAVSTCVSGSDILPCARIPNLYMGFAVRTLSTRYVEWRDFLDDIIGCAQPNWPGFPTDLQQQTIPKVVVNRSTSGTLWGNLPLQREMYDDYPISANISWAKWESENVLVSRLGNVNDLRIALELSVAIRWKFDVNFHGAEEPCSGNGFVRLKQPTLWTDFSKQPEFMDVYCECVDGYSGLVCEIG